MIKMNPLTALCLLTLYMAGCGSTATKQDTHIDECNSLPQCLNMLETVTFSRYGLSDDEEAFAKSFTKFGESALEELLHRLDIESEKRQDIVGYAISQFDPIDEKYLPKIVEGVKNKVGWLANALGNIYTPKAAEATVDAYLTSDSAPHNQEANAVKKQGERAVPFIIQRMQCGERCENNEGLLVYIVGEMDDSTKVFISNEIIAQLNNPNVSRANQANLISLFFNLGAQGIIAEKELEQLALKYPKLSPQIDQAFVGIHSKHSGRVFGGRIKQNPDNYLVLRDVAELGAIAKDAGPVIVDLLSSESSETKVAAVRALGFLQYKPAAQDLIKLLKDTQNIQLNWVVVNTLGRLGQTSSIPALESIEKEHWYSAIQDEARLAIQHIREGSSYDAKFHKNNFAFDFFGYQHLDVKSCKKVKLKRLSPGSLQKRLSSRDTKELESLSYSSYRIGYTAGDEEEQKVKDPDGIIIVNQNNIVEVREEVQKTPNVAVRTKQGWLTGYDGGEWGGELMYVPDSGEPVELLNGNVNDLFKLGQFYIALTGLAHMSMNEGIIYRVVEMNGSWRAEPWVTLPGAPKESWLTETGEVLIDTYSGGTILLSEDGTLRMAPCDGYEDDY